MNFCGNLANVLAITNNTSLLRVPSVVPNATTITPSSPELCMNYSNFFGNRLEGLVRSGPTILVSVVKV